MTNPIGRSWGTALPIAVLSLALLVLAMPGTALADYRSRDYFPLPDTAYWEYSDGSSATVVSGTTLINGVATKQLRYDLGDKEFYTNDAQGVRLHRVFVTGYPETTGTFRAPVPMAKATANVGDQLNASGKVDMVIQDYGTAVLNYTSTSKITGTEVITVPFGTFTTVKLVSTLRIYGTAAGQPIDETTVITYWLAPGIGPVKADEGPPDYLVYELVDTNLPDLIPCIIINGTSGDDTLEGTPAKDCINGRAGNDSMYGLGDNDVYTVQNAGDVVIEGAGEGTDTIKSSVSYRLPIYVEKLTLTGAANIRGTGNGLANVIRGNSGNNTLNGAAGNDTLRGGAGKDRFLFNTPPGAGNVDRITDFTPVDDTIRLENAVFTGLPTTGVLSAAAFALGTAATTAEQRILYDPATGNLRYDADGTGPAAAVRFATLTTKPAITRADFVVQ